jgi:hypothetical protein
MREPLIAAIHESKVEHDDVAEYLKLRRELRQARR